MIRRQAGYSDHTQSAKIENDDIRKMRIQMKEDCRLILDFPTDITPKEIEDAYSCCCWLALQMFISSKQCYLVPEVISDKFEKIINAAQYIIDENDPETLNYPENEKKRKDYFKFLMIDNIRPEFFVDDYDSNIDYYDDLGWCYEDIWFFESLRCDWCDSRM